ncbi:MAG: CPBP family intramembrane glutamic endopeptidase [Chryseolinea sp.]
MLQILAIFGISWLIVWLYDRSNLSILGLRPTPNRSKLAAILFIQTAICYALSFLLRIFLVKEQYTLNGDLSFENAGLAVWETVRGSITEEMLCRGVLLYILIRKLGNTRAIILSSFIFGLMHWINVGVFGNVIEMSITFVFTFSMGLLLAYSYIRTLSILIPFAINLGWNLTQNFIFPEGQYGTHLFVFAFPPPMIVVSYPAFFFMQLFPKVAAIGLAYLLVKNFESIPLKPSTGQ